MRLGPTSSSTSGQVLLIVVLLMVLLIVTIPVLIQYGGYQARFNVTSLKGMMGRISADEGLSYAMRILSADQTTWNNALGGSFPADFYAGASPRLIQAPSGNRFTIECSIGGGIADYQVRVRVTSYVSTAGRTGPRLGSKWTEAILSQHTSGVSVSGNLQAPAALQVMGDVNMPPPPGSLLDVRWGPVVSFSNNPAFVWTFTDPMDTGRYPRKFSQGGIKGTTNNANDPLYRSPTFDPPTSDSKEYWAFTNLGVPLLVDESQYEALAQNPTLVDNSERPIKLSDSTPINASPTAGTGRFVVAAGDAASFSLPNGFTHETGDNLYEIFVKGDAQFNDMAVDFWFPGPVAGNAYQHAASFVVTGNLTLANTVSGIQAMDLRVPLTAALEYPYNDPQTWPCHDKVGDICTLAQAGVTKVNYRGFLYVKNDLHVTGNWVIVGSVYVGGNLTIDSGAALTILYDDKVNGFTQVTAVHLNVDSVTSSPLQHL